MPSAPRPSTRPELAHEPNLLQACRAGDRAALSQLLAEHGPGLERICRRMSTPEAYEDILQDTYLTIVRAIASFRGESAFLTWAYAVCRSCASRWYERRRRDPGLSSASGARTDELPASSARPSAVEAGELVRLVLVALPPLDRDILLMRDSEGMSAAEVARETGLTVGAVKTRLHRARVAARARITELDAPAQAA